MDLEFFTTSTGETYASKEVVIGTTTFESFDCLISGTHKPMYVRHFLTICEASFQTPVSNIKVGMCGALTHGDEVWRFSVKQISPGVDWLKIRGLALVSERLEALPDAPSLIKPSKYLPAIWRQFYDL